MSLLEIRDLRAQVEGREILKGIHLTVNPGEVHAIMGLNGSGKSTLAGVLAGREVFEVTSGQVLFQGEDLLELDPEERANRGLFLAFQHPVELPGVNNMYFLRAALNAQRKYRGEPEISAVEFTRLVREKARLLQIDQELLNRSVNVGFSGGEKKRNEALQMAVLDPKLAILDETDTGLDVDALRIVGNAVSALRDGQRAFIVITHLTRLLNYITPDYVHVMMDGRLVRSGARELAYELEERGYGWIERELAATA